MNMPARPLPEFIRDSSPSDSPDVAAAGQRLVADTLAAAFAGTLASSSVIVARFAASQFREGDCTVFGTSGLLAPTGAALANANTANAIDIDESVHATKGHPGACVVPAALAVAEDVCASGKEFLDAVIVAYEVAVRAGLTAHAVRPTYHCTGSWAAVGAAAGCLRLLRATDLDLIGDALGTAEYQSCYSPMMRCIAHPAMVKDAIGWGAMNGVAAAELAMRGYTGIPSLLEPPSDDGGIAHGEVATLGDVWWVRRTDYKSLAGCHWGHPAVEGLRHIMTTSHVQLTDIRAIELHVFANAAELSIDVPTNAEEAQYNLAYPLACWAIYGEVGPQQIVGGYDNPDVQALMRRIAVQVDRDAEAAFPHRQLGRTSVQLHDGRVFASPLMEALGNHSRELTDEQAADKFHWLVAPVLGEQRSHQLHDLLSELRSVPSVSTLSKLLAGGQAR
jgi:2-methylcitrate dehydratase PrpD